MPVPAPARKERTSQTNIGARIEFQKDKFTMKDGSNCVNTTAGETIIIIHILTQNSAVEGGQSRLPESFSAIKATVVATTAVTPPRNQYGMRFQNIDVL